MGPLFRYSSSLRVASLEQTLASARSVAPQLGISRVTDITRLDGVGVPVFASIRPDAQRGSLCVNAGKGLTVAEAQVGAYMEAIEYAFAEYNRASIKTVRRPARKVYEGPDRADSILDFCPIMNAEIDLDAPLTCVQAEEIVSGEKYWVPAELVFFPYPDAAGEEEYFGSNTNGLCSGNTVLEATVHGLAEVMERDILSFYFLDDQSTLVDPDSLPSSILPMASSLSTAGLELHVRTLKNCFGIPFFMAFVSDPRCHSPHFVNGGFGCNPSRSIALTRAVCEALQSRLSFIHGGRDDLQSRHQRFEGWPLAAQEEFAERLRKRIARADSKIHFEEIEDHSEMAVDLESSLRWLLSSLSSNRFPHVLRLIYTPPDFPLPVVRILVPGLENFNEHTQRIGLRLRDYVQSRP